uniref:Uncharacterized protein n=1 Tax=Rhodnius prolixus TaxID=13249 RepID=T1HYC6_RHOPR
MAVGKDKESDDSHFDDDDDCINIFAPFAQKSANITEAWKTEIINYTKLDQAPVEVDILEWWKTLENSFKNLSRMELKYYKNMQQKYNVPFEKQKLDAVSRDTRV